MLIGFTAHFWVSKFLDFYRTCSWKYKWKYRKFPKYSDTQKICCNHSKIWTMWFYHRVMSPRDADGMANSADPDQTAPPQCRPWSDCSSRSSLIWVCTVCPDLSVRKLRKITVGLNLSLPHSICQKTPFPSNQVVSLNEEFPFEPHLLQNEWNIESFTCTFKYQGYESISVRWLSVWNYNIVMTLLFFSCRWIWVHLSTNLVVNAWTSQMNTH